MALVQQVGLQVLGFERHHLDGRVVKAGHRVAFEYTPRPGYIYVPSRAISSRTNDNYDTFPPEEIAASYRSFIGKPVFVSHNNERVGRMRGVIIDAALHRDTNPDGTPDTWAEVLMEVDAVRFPKLAARLIDRDIERTSMGCNVEWSECSYCANKATTPLEYCAHVSRMKGKRLRKQKPDGTTEIVLVSEICHGLSFFENSLLVEPPADPTAYTLGVDTRGLAVAAARRPARAEPRYSPDLTPEIQVEAGPRHADPSQHPFFQLNPLNPNHIVSMWNRAAPDEREQGMRWYPDAHIVATALGHGNAHVGAGVIAAYSPQTSWPRNLFNAGRSLHTGVALGGPGSGVYATGSMRDQAQRIMDGEDYNNVLVGPKVRAFAHLIEHGGDAGPSRVVVDRHALSVAAGRRMSTDDLAQAPLGNHHYYQHPVDQYTHAAGMISTQSGLTVPPHAVQAATWMAQQRLNSQADEANAGGRGRNKATSNDQEAWEQFRDQNYRDLSPSSAPGYHVQPDAPPRQVAHVASIRKRAYGEQVAPRSVDTLREEACPICSDTDSYDGQGCPVCGYIPPPDQLADPDLDKAREVDQDGGQAERPGLGPSDEPNQIVPPLLNFSGQRSRRSTVGMSATSKSKPRAAGPVQSTAAVDRQRLMAAMASQQRQIGEMQQVIRDLRGQLGVLVHLAGAGAHPRLAGLVRCAEVADGAPLAPVPSGVESPPEYRDGFAEGQQDGLTGGEGLAGVAHMARWDSRSASWKLGWGAGFEAAQKTASTRPMECESCDHKWRTSSTVRVKCPECGEGDHIKVDKSKTSRRRTASDENNSPVATTNDGALAPAATDDPTTPGAAPAAANQGVTPDAATTPGDTDVALPQEPYNDLIDVTDVAPGADTNVPSPADSHVEYDITADSPSLDVAYPESGWTSTSSAQVRARMIDSMRLARLRIAAGLARGDDLVLAAQIEQSHTSSEAIRAEIGTLERVRTAAARQRPSQPAPVRPVPQQPSPQRRTPSLGGGGIAPVTAASGGAGDEEFLDL